jgi:recombination protein RecA
MADAVVLKTAVLAGVSVRVRLGLRRERTKLELDEVLQGLDVWREPPGNASISTGSLGLDIALDGGWRQGRICELSGDYSTYKTSMALHTVAQAQNLGDVLWLDSGSDFNLEHARRVGVDLTSLTVCYPDDANRAMYTMRTAAQDYALMVLDSASGLDFQWHTQLHFERWFSWLKRDIQPRTTALFITNQFATKDQAFTRELRKWSDQQVTMMPFGKYGTEAVVNRNAVSRPVNWRMFFAFGKDAVFDSAYELVMLGQQAGIIEVRGSWGYFAGGQLGHGVQGCARALRENPKLALNLRDAIRNLI